MRSKEMGFKNREKTLGFKKREKTQKRDIIIRISISIRIREIVENPQVVLHKNIPQDIIDEILTRLPFKSLLRFKAVSKLWYSTISNHSFRRRCQPATLIFTVTSPSTYYPRNRIFHTIDEKGSMENIRVEPTCKTKSDEMSKALISNSCNGLLLLCLGKEIFLVNPSTHYIDRVLILKKLSNKVICDVGFCHDESIDDYKAIMFTRSGFENSVIVASLTQKEWTTVQIPGNFCRMSRGPLVNDRLHLADRDRSGAHNSIVYFNPIKDVFEKVACPQPKSGNQDVIVALGVLEGCLCMARKIGNDVEVLKMKEYGVAESWTSIFFVIKYFVVAWYKRNYLSELLLMTKNGEILIKEGRKMWRYNLEKESFTKFVPDGYIGNIEAAVTFEESLFSPKRSVVDHMARKCSIARRSDGSCFNCGKIEHFAKDCPRGIVCHNCGTPGHLPRNCIF